MLLAADIGNTNIVTGIFDGQKLICRFRMATDPGRTRDEYTLFLKHFLSENGIENLPSARLRSPVLFHRWILPSLIWPEHGSAQNHFLLTKR